MSKDRLEELKVNFYICSLEELGEVRCPNLKRLTISTSGFRSTKFVRIVDAFLKNQPPLEELDLSLIYHFPHSILQTLEKNDKLGRMKKLHLKTRFWVGQCGEPDWKFLEKMPELKDFRIRKTSWNRIGLTPTMTPLQDHVEDAFDNGYRLLKHLPSSVEKISLQGFQYFWEMCPKTTLGKLLPRFQNLKELNLLRSREALMDGSLQYIISHCTSLTLLSFSDCPDLTDFGITGNRDGQQIGRSLNELKNLQHLTIRSCKNVSLQALIASVQFEHLRFFDFFKPSKTGFARLTPNFKKFFLHIGNNNPSLAEIHLHYPKHKTTEEFWDLFEQMRKIRPRVNLEQGERWGDSEDNVCSDDIIGERYGPDDERLTEKGIVDTGHRTRHQTEQSYRRLLSSMGINTEF